MRLIFAGTPMFAAVALRALIAAGHDIALVLTQPDRPAGRGLRLAASAVAEVATEAGLNVAKPVSLKTPEGQALVTAAGAELMVVAAYGLILPQAVLDIPPLGCLNIHGSILPRWRGAAPVQRAIAAGDSETGVDIMQMEAGLDTGPVLYAKRTAILPTDTAATLTERLARLGADAIVATLAALPTLAAKQQNDALMTYAKKIEKAEAKLNWAQPATQIERLLRAFDPFPGCETALIASGAIASSAMASPMRFKVWRGSVVHTLSGPPGEVLAITAEGPVIGCGDGQGAICLTWCQQPGGKRQLASDFLKKFPLTLGDRFESA